jgi:hypothetical protein
MNRHDQQSAAKRARCTRNTPLTLLTATLIVGSAAQADNASKLDASRDTPAWLHGSDASVLIGSGSPAFNRLVKSELGEQSPCAAVALLSFTPAESSLSRWEIILSGQPTARTVALVASRAAPVAVNQSTRYLGTPYDPGRGTYVAIRITTEPVGAEQAWSTIVCRAVDANGSSLSQQPLEAPVRFLWSRKSAQLLALYRTPASAAAP